MNVWNQTEKPCLLSSSQTEELYEQAANILTSYLDIRSFRQIYPWHHAAGDFVVNESENPPSVRLITVRGYRTLLKRKSDSKNKMLGALHFFLNLSVRMRIDRLDGTGELAWAGPDSVARGVLRGFMRAWEAKARASKDLPGANEIFALFLDLSHEERLAFAEFAAADGQVEAEETAFLTEHLSGHVIELSEAMKNFL